ncbi:diguanylate cyclase [Salinibius halmophilus]|uniref:diguanylate cyclase n=1 Tax=Salinibius halmophilus TaxID=1853216 RepID=UPI000E665077|nr:diguanylate cyclase [Salinibius halmophilus]
MERRRQQTMRNTIEWLVGPANKPLQQLQLSLMVIAAIYMWVTAFFNLYFGIGYILFSYGMMLLAIVTTGFWYLGRWRNICYVATVCVLALLIVMLLPAIYLANGGINGPALLYALVVMTYCYGVLKQGSIEKIVLMTLSITIPIPLMVLEYQQPSAVYLYSSTSVKMLDLWVSFFLCASLLISIVAGHVRRFKQELYRARRLTVELERRARLDGLTNIYNHKAIFEYARAMMARHTPMSVIIFDLDYFKQINDTYGHPFGDDVLVEFSRVLSESGAGEVGRIGGEEFMLICENDSSVVLERVLFTLKATWQRVDLEHHPITFSAGVAVRKPADTLETLWQRADEALYLAKHSGRNQWRVAA